MLKIRLMETKNDIKWFEKLLERQPKVAVTEVSKMYRNYGILKHEEGIDLMPGNIELSGLEVPLVNVMSREGVMRSYVEPARERYDYILIDCMPSLGMITINAFACADSIIRTGQYGISFHACCIGKRSIAGGRNVGFRRMDIASLCMSLDSSTCFRHSRIGYTLLLDMSYINIPLRDSWFYGDYYFFQKSGLVDKILKLR